MTITRWTSCQDFNILGQSCKTWEYTVYLHIFSNNNNNNFQPHDDVVDCSSSEILTASSLLHFSLTWKVVFPPFCYVLWSEDQTDFHACVLKLWFCFQGLYYLHNKGKMHRDIKVSLERTLIVKHVYCDYILSVTCTSRLWPEITDS